MKRRCWVRGSGIRLSDTTLFAMQWSVVGAQADAACGALRPCGPALAGFSQRSRRQADKRESPHQRRAWGSVNQDRAGVTGLPALKSYAIRIYRVTAGFVVSMTFDRSITVTGFGQGLQFADQVVDGHLGISGRAIPSKVNAEFRGS